MHRVFQTQTVLIALKVLEILYGILINPDENSIQIALYILFQLIFSISASKYNVSFVNVRNFNDLHMHRQTHTHESRYNMGYTQTLYCVTFVNRQLLKYTVHGFAIMAQRPRELTEVDRQQMIDGWTSSPGLVCLTGMI